MTIAKLPIKCIYSQAPLDTELTDSRGYTAGLTFGKIEDICQQYGVKYKQLDNCIEYSAPKNRMQHFIEKFHFSRHPYAYQPY